MNDRAISLLENYDFTVLKVHKARGAFICETNQGLKIMKEYQAPLSKLGLMDMLLKRIGEDSEVFVDTPVADKEGNFIGYDRDGIGYVVKNYFEGRECSPRENDDLRLAMHSLALLHRKLAVPIKDMPEGLHRFDLQADVERQNRGLKRIRTYIRGRGRKTEFELALLDAYGLFLDRGVRVEERMRKEDFSDLYETIESKGEFAHGDFQYHNVLFGKDKAAIVNFEKSQWDSKVRDIALFMRKTLEKADWNYDLGSMLLKEYEEVSPLTEKEKRQLFYRLSYPEKFRKIANFYYNSNKAFLSAQYMSKLENVLRLEKSQTVFLRKVFDDEI